jgi:uncharacterized membrane protein
MFSVIAFAGLAVDVGNAYVQRRSVQNVADAAALAGAAAIPAGTTTTAAQQMATKNDKPGDAVFVSFNASDTVTVTVQRTAPTFLLRVLGKNSIPVWATAQATIEAVGAVKRTRLAIRRHRAGLRQRHRNDAV